MLILLCVNGRRFRLQLHFEHRDALTREGAETGQIQLMAGGSNPMNGDYSLLVSDGIVAARFAIFLAAP